MKTIYQLIDELEVEMNKLRVNYPELFSPHHAINRNIVAVQNMAAAIRNMGAAVRGLETPLADLTAALASEQARRRQGRLASWWNRIRNTYYG